MALIRIIPAIDTHGEVTPTQGTKVFLGDTEITGIYRIEVTADINDVWRAVIHCHCHVEGITAEAEFVDTRSWWERFSDYIKGY